MPDAGSAPAIACECGWIGPAARDAAGAGAARRKAISRSSTKIPSSIVVNKPAGLLTVPLPRRGDEASVEDQLAVHLRRRGKRKPLVVHRIDRDTSGLVVFATRPDAQRRLKNQFRRHEPERVYLAVVYGHPSPESGTWRDRLVWDQAALIQKQTHPRDPRGKDAISEYRVLERFPRASLLEVRLRTGKRNQIRLQARLRGHTLVGEQRYVFGPDELRIIDFPRQALHSHRLALSAPGHESTAELRGSSTVGHGGSGGPPANPNRLDRASNQSSGGLWPRELVGER